MAVDLFLYFNGNCCEAVDFYAQVFGVEKQPVMRFGDMPPGQGLQITDEAKDLIMYTYLPIMDSNVMFSDVFPGTPYYIGNNINITISSKDIEEIKAWFEKLSQGGAVTMQLQETGFSKCYGSVVDRYGVPWQLVLDSGEMEQ